MLVVNVVGSNSFFDVHCDCFCCHLHVTIIVQYRRHNCGKGSVSLYLCWPYPIDTIITSRNIVRRYHRIIRRRCRRQHRNRWFPFGAILLDFDLLQYLILLGHDVLFAHANTEALDQSAFLAEASRHNGNIAAIAERTLQWLVGERIATKEGFAALAGDRIEIVAECLVAADGT